MAASRWSINPLALAAAEIEFEAFDNQLEDLKSTGTYLEVQEFQKKYAAELTLPEKRFRETFREDWEVGKPSINNNGEFYIEFDYSGKGEKPYGAAFNCKLRITFGKDGQVRTEEVK